MTRRTLLFVPVTAQRFLDKAHERGADTIILDLEDSIPPDVKPAARAALPNAVQSLVRRGIDVWVRVNAPRPLLADDLAAATITGVTGLMIPKVESADEIRFVDTEMSRLEDQRCIPKRSITLCATLETPLGILATNAIAAIPRLSALALGCEDLAAAMGVPPRHSFLRGPAQTIALAAAAHGLESWGVAGSIANHTNLTRFERECRLTRALGTTAIICIHPAQVTVAARAYAPTADELAWATDVVGEYERAKTAGVGSISVRGQMIDEPVYLRAKRMLA
jgi:citrate lyase subunit beta / citryl-CoA lyase